MIRLMRLVLITGSVAVVLITTSLFGQDAGQDQDLSPVPPAPAKVVLVTPAPPPARMPSATIEAAPSNSSSGAQGVAIQTSDAEKKLQEVSKTVRQTLSLGRPRGVQKWLATLSEQSKYRVDITSAVEGILARGIAARQLAKNAPQSLTFSGVNASLNDLSEQDIANIFDEQTKSSLGLKVPDQATLDQHIKRHKQKVGLALGVPAQSLALGAAPDKSMPAFNWTQKGIVTAARDQGNCVPCSVMSCGCCWAFATIAAFEAAYAKANGILIAASEQYLLSCSQPVLSHSNDQMLASQPWTCDGGWWAFDMLIPDPTNPLLPVPGVPYRDSSTYTGNLNNPSCPTLPVIPPYVAAGWNYVAGAAVIPSNDDLKDALCKFGPLVIAIFGDTHWRANQGDVIADRPNDAPNSIAVNHAVVLIGWDNLQNNGNGAWIIKNSWGPGYGIQNSGFLYIGYNFQNIGYSAAYVVPGPAVPIQP